MGWTDGLKAGLDKTWKWTDKHLGEPTNRFSHRLGLEGFWPTDLARESDKAARTLLAFVTEGVEAEVGAETADDGENAGKGKEKAKEEEVINTNVAEEPRGKKRKQKLKIPQKALRDAKGIAIFTIMRTGFIWSGAGGSGIVIARNPTTNEWGAPSGIMMHVLGWGLLAGVDVVSVVLILRTEGAVNSFAHPKVTLGGEVSAAAGPLGMGGALDASVNQAPCWSYTRSKGLYAGIQLDGSIVIERSDENERYYGHPIKARDILLGHVIAPSGSDGLIEALKLAEGRTDVDRTKLPGGKAPSDQELSKEDREAAGMTVQPFGGFATGLDGRPVETGLTPDIRDVTKGRDDKPPMLPPRTPPRRSLPAGSNPFDIEGAPALPPREGDVQAQEGSESGEDMTTSRDEIMPAPILPPRDPAHTLRSSLERASPRSSAEHLSSAPTLPVRSSVQEEERAEKQAFDEASQDVGPGLNHHAHVSMEKGPSGEPHPVYVPSEQDETSAALTASSVSDEVKGGNDMTNDMAHVDLDDTEGQHETEDATSSPTHDRSISDVSYSSATSNTQPSPNRKRTTGLDDLLKDAKENGFSNDDEDPDDSREQEESLS